MLFLIIYHVVPVQETLSIQVYKLLVFYANLKYLPKKHHGMLSLKLKTAWGMTDYDTAPVLRYEALPGWEHGLSVGAQYSAQCPEPLPSHRGIESTGAVDQRDDHVA